MGEPGKTPSPRPRLGRGLSSLISSLTSSPPRDSQYSSVSEEPAGSKAAVALPSEAPPASAEIPTDQIGPNPFQPRQDFAADELADLAASIARHGVLQSIRVTKSTDPGCPFPYMVVAGERRLRAARMAGLKTIPAVVGDATPEQMLQWAVVENVHRSNLNPIERGQAYLQFLDRFGVNQADLALSLGEPRTTISNYLRILDLNPEVRSMIAAGRVSFGHAKVLAGLIGHEAIQLQLAKRVEADGISVRDLETLVTRAFEASAPAPASAQPVRPPFIRDLEDRLSAAVGTRVSVRPGRAKNTGRLVIEYYSLDDFERISRMLGVQGE